MKFYTSFACVLLLSGAAFAQKNSPTPPPVVLPVDSITHLVTYEAVTQVPGATSEVLYKRALDWFNTNYKNPTEVIRENDVGKGIIVGKPRFRIYNPPDKEGTKTDAGIVQYTITVGIKEGRFKYELTEFNWKQLSYYPIEKWMDTKGQMYTPVFNHYLTQTDEHVKELIKNLKNALMSDKPVKDKDNW
jgi:hypothetical protein